MPNQEPDYEQQYADREEARYFPTAEQLEDRYVRMLERDNR